jgi:hypothetical protein
MVDMNATGQWAKDKLLENKKMSAYALIVALLSGGGGFTGFNAAIDVADARWMTHKQHVMQDLKSYIRQLRREIRDLEYDIKEGIATPRDEWELERLKEDLLEAEEEYGG